MDTSTTRIYVAGVLPEASEWQLRAAARLLPRVDELPPAERRRVKKLARLCFLALKTLEN